MWMRIARRSPCRRRTRRRCGRRVQLVHWRTASSWYLLRCGGVRRNYIDCTTCRGDGVYRVVARRGVPDSVQLGRGAGALTTGRPASHPLLSPPPHATHTIIVYTNLTFLRVGRPRARASGKTLESRGRSHLMTTHLGENEAAGALSVIAQLHGTLDSP